MGHSVFSKPEVTMLYVFLVLSIILFVLLLFTIFRLWQIKQELRRFAEETDKRCDPEYAQPLKVGFFDKDIVQLAIAADRHVEIQRELAIHFQRRETQLSHVISGISHDFRTPLTASIGYLQMVQKSAVLSETEQEYLTIAIQKNQYLKSLSDDFFELNCLTHNPQDSEPEQVNLSNLLTECLLSQYDWIEKRGIQPQIRIDEGIVLQSSRRHLTRILENLFSNAAKYAVSQLRIALTMQDTSAVLTIANDILDTEELHIAYIFEPFYRGASRTSEGSGLGLYVVKTLCDELGYKINATNENGQFSITMTIPTERNE